MKIKTYMQRGAGLVLALLMMGSAESFGQTARQPGQGRKSNRNAMTAAVVAPVAINDTKEHDKDLDMYSPKPGGIEAERNRKNKVVNVDASDRQGAKERKLAIRKERRAERRAGRVKAHKDRQALGSRVTVMKNADPRKVRRTHR